MLADCQTRETLEKFYKNVTDEAGYTEKILDALKENDVKATFFITGHYLNTAGEIVQRMVEEGHVVGNHTVNHHSMPDLSEEEIKEEEVYRHEEGKIEDEVNSPGIANENQKDELQNNGEEQSNDNATYKNYSSYYIVQKS